MHVYEYDIVRVSATQPTLEEYSQLCHNPYPSVDPWDLWVIIEYGLRRRSIPGWDFRLFRAFNALGYIV